MNRSRDPTSAQQEHRVAVGYSGGRDSTALLHATLRAAKPLGVRVLALHVHHGLNPLADAWLQHCRLQCERWRRRGWPIEFAFDRLTGSPAPGDSVEEWARERRYRALNALAVAHRVDLVLLAHHQQDQAETFLLQAFRGAGVAGLAAMPAQAERAGIHWARPWLHETRASIEAYVRRCRLRYVDDDSNGDARFARNRLRLEVWPAMSSAFPHAAAALARSATWSQEALQCLEELAALDLRQVAGAKGLDVPAWLQLSEARRSNALRAWLLTVAGRGAAIASLTTRLLAELPNARSASWPIPNGELRLYRERLSPQLDTVALPAGLPEAQLSVQRSADHALPGWGGTLRVRRCQSGGVPLAWLAHLDLRARSGAEQFQAGIGRPPRSLKKQYQAAAIPASVRNGPLLYSGGQLIFVPGLGIDARVLALPGQAQVNLEWHPHCAAAPSSAAKGVAKGAASGAAKAGD